MFTITSTMIGSFIIAIGITLKKYIFKKLKKEGTLANVIYLTLLVSISFPLYIWPFNFTISSLNYNSAKELVNKVLQYKYLSKYKLDTLVWKPYDSKKNLFNIKAIVNDENEEPYFLYLQPTCKFFKGCKVGLDRIIMIEPAIKNIPVEKMNEKIFIRRLCEDKITRELLIKTNIEPFFQKLFEKYNTFKNANASYRLDSIKLHNFKQTKTEIKNIENDKFKLTNSCQANLYIKGDFKIENKNYDFTDKIIYAMFDNVQKERNGYIIKTKIDYNIYTNPKEGILNINSRFVNLKRLKKLGEKVKSKKIQKPKKSSSCSFDIDFPKNLIVLAGGAYKGKKSNFQIDDSGHEATLFDVTVNYPHKNVALFLSAYEPSVWNIKWTKDTNISAVYITGYHRQILLGISKNVPVINSTYQNKRGCGSFNLSKSSIKELNPISKRVFGKNVDIAYLAKDDGKIIFGDIVKDEKKLEFSHDYQLSQFIDKSKPLAGQMGLKQLSKKGYIRPYTKEDIEKWAKLQKKIYERKEKNLPKVINADIRQSFKPPFVLHGYTILKKITIPSGLYGGNAATFFLPKGVPFPKGNLGHSTLYDFNTGKCYGVMCGVKN